jgi:phage replication-related protein YjqB (UPF0714/DUF867 family)
MTHRRILAAIIFLGSVGITTLARAEVVDTYKNYADLAAHAHEGSDYRVTVEDRGASHTVMAIHGGWMEGGTAELARAVAGVSGWNLYLFEADDLKYHLTSTHFDEPRAVALAGKSQYALSLHGFYQGEDHASIACVGGGGGARARAVARALRAHAKELALEVESPCERFGGSDPANIVNRAREPGVQIEMSRPLRDRVRASAEFGRRLASTIGTALVEGARQARSGGAASAASTSPRNLAQKAQKAGHE